MQLDSFEDVEPFLKGFETESDRACAILAGVLLDELLKHLLQRVMIEDAPNKIFDYPGALSSFSAKIDAAYYFSHLSRDEYEEMGHIRKIRNEFAHQLDPGLAFDSPRIHKLTRLLKLPAVNINAVELEHGALPVEMPRYGDNPRDAFIVSVRLMVGFIQRRAREYERPEEPSSFRDVLSSLEIRAKMKQRYGNYTNLVGVIGDDARETNSDKDEERNE